MTGSGKSRLLESYAAGRWYAASDDGQPLRDAATGELVRWLRAAGFGRVRLFAGDGKSPYELGTPRLIVVADA